MARPKNSADTVQITISTTPVVKALLEALVSFGLHGKNSAEASERLLNERLMQMLSNNDTMAGFLNDAHKKIISHVSESR